MRYDADPKWRQANKLPPLRPNGEPFYTIGEVGQIYPTMCHKYIKHKGKLVTFTFDCEGETYTELVSVSWPCWSGEIWNGGGATARTKRRLVAKMLIVDLMARYGERQRKKKEKEREALDKHKQICLEQ